MKTFLSRYWFLLLVPLFISIGLYFEWKEIKLKNHIYNEAIGGNRTAISLLKYSRRAWELHEKTVREAIAGNENAQEILGMKEKK